MTGVKLCSCIEAYFSYSKKDVEEKDVEEEERRAGWRRRKWIRLVSWSGDPQISACVRFTCSETTDSWLPSQKLM